jgi:hypothetical protein
VRDFHAAWAYVVVGLNLIVGLWGLLFVRRNPPAPRLFWAAVGGGQAALLVQFLVGLLLTRTYGRPGLHLFYGFVITFVAVLAWAFRGDEKRNIIVFSSVALFVGAVAIRAMITA